MKILGTEPGEGQGVSRVYPPWVAPTRKKAREAQTLQLPYFASNADEFRILARKLAILEGAESDPDVNARCRVTVTG